MAAAAPPPPPKTVFERLHDASGPVLGLDAITLTRMPSVENCGGERVVVTTSPIIPAEDAVLAAVYAIEFPTNLSFDENDATRRQQSLEAFNQFLQQMMQTVQAAMDHYVEQGRATRDPAAVARSAQAMERFASVLVRAPIPAEIRTGEFAADKSKAYCDALAMRGEPLVDQAEKMRKICRDVEQGKPQGWWTTYCAL